MAHGIAITGGSSGLGAALVHRFGADQNWHVFDLSPGEGGPQHIDTDVRHYASVEAAAYYCQQSHKWPLKYLINCAGVNGISYLEDMTMSSWDEIISVNTRGIFYTVKAFLPQLAPGGTVANIVSNASHMPMTGSLAYNASKGAAHIMTLQLARELTRRHQITVFGISPGKLAGTGMSRYIDERVPSLRGWTREEADAYQRLGRLHPEEIPPDTIADFIHFLLSSKRNHEHLTGCVIPYGA